MPRLFPALLSTLLLMAAVSAHAQSVHPNYGAYTIDPLYDPNAVLGWADERIEEPLGRGLIATHQEKGRVYLSWRLLKADPSRLGFNVYRISGEASEENAEPLNDTPITQTTDYVDDSVNLSQPNRWYVTPVIDGEEREPSQHVHLPANPPIQAYKAIPLKNGVEGRGIHKIGIGDLDGDGEYDLVVKRPRGVVDPGTIRPSPHTFKVEGYLNDGTFLWRNDLGWSIEQGTWYSPMIVHDLNGDGIAEVAIKTSEGDHRNERGQVLTGPEYLSVWAGDTGEAIARTNWIDRGQPQDWGDYQGNRMNRNMLGVAYLDGKTPSVVVLRGIYGLMKMETWFLQDNTLRQAWQWTNETAGWRYQGQGQHFIHVADIDGDGKDEILNGAIAVDHDGKTLWSTGYGHGDRFYISDIDPQREGLEIWYSYEDPHPQNGVSLWEAKSGRLIFGTEKATEDDQIDRALTSDIDPNYPGMEVWADGYLYTAQGKPIPGEIPPLSGLVWWDADPLRELQQRNRVWKWQGDTLTETIEGYTVAWADIVGDWREEIITYTDNELHIYTTNIPAADRRVTLMQDPLYRMDVALISMGYEHVPMTSYYLGTNSVNHE